MLAKITEDIINILLTAGIPAGRAYPTEEIIRKGVFVRVSAESVKRGEAGFGCYIGSETDDLGAAREVYGMRCSVGLSLGIYAPPGGEGAEKCEALADDIIFALGGMSGLRIHSFSCGGAKPDSDTEMMLCQCRAEIGLFLTADAPEGEEPIFSDFILKGEIRK